MALEPPVSVVVVNYNGRAHLEPCLSSLAGLDYPADRLEIMLADNGSSDGSVELVEERFPDVRIVRFSENLGFARANNLAAEQAGGKYLALLNNDARVEPDWLRRLLEPLAADPEIVCVGGKVLDWEGERVDFAGAAMTFEGFALARLNGQPVAWLDDGPAASWRPVLFACGGAMVIDREVFLGVGGFDEDYFAIYEDADLGWRLWLYGYKVVYAPAAVAHHRQGATLKQMPTIERQRMMQRNALATILKNYGDASLARVLPAALLLATTRASGVADEQKMMAGGVEILQLDGAGEAVDHGAAAGLAVARGVAEVGARLSTILARRHEVQRRRRRSDGEIFELFGHSLGCLDTRRPYLEAHYEVANSLGVPEVFGGVGHRVLVIASDLLPFPGCPTSGAGMRAWGLGKALEHCGHEVLFSIPKAALEGYGAHLPPEVAELAWIPETIMEVIARAEPNVVIACNWPIAAAIGETPVPVVLDQAGPHLLERHYQHYGDLLSNFENKLAGLARADFFTCCGEWQRLYFLPWLQLAGFNLDEDRIRTIPFSMPPDLPDSARPQEPVFVYSGMYLPWTDPTTPLAAVVEELERRGHGRLEIVGGKHPVYEVDAGVFPDLVARLARSPRVQTHAVLPYDDLIARLSRASVAVDLMKRNAERTVALTTRTIVYLWCGLPVIYNDYSELSELIRDYGAGWTIDPDDPRAMRTVLDEIFTNPSAVDERSANARRLVRERFTWDGTIELLDAFVRRPSVRHRQPTLSRLIAERAARAAADKEAAQAAQLAAARAAAEEAERNKTFGQRVGEAVEHFRQGGPRRLLHYGFAFLAKQCQEQSVGGGDAHG